MTLRYPILFQQGDLPLPSGPVLALRAPAGLTRADLPAHAVIEQGFLPAARALSEAGFQVVPQAGGVFDLVLVFPTRSRDETRALVARAAAMTAPGGMVVIDGDRTDGIDSLMRALREALPGLNQIARAHGRVLWFYPDDAGPGLAALLHTWLDAGQPARNAEGWLTAPGLFSPDHPDPASRLLAQTIPETLSGRAADLGAGWGWLSAAVLARCPGISSLTLVEAEHLALDLAQQNVTDPRAQFLWADATRPEDCPGRLDLVISNPPFHAGRAADPGLGAAFVRSAARLLAPRGQFWLVANRHLPYESVLDSAFAQCQTMVQTGQFKVIMASRPRTGSRPGSGPATRSAPRRR